MPIANNHTEKARLAVQYSLPAQPLASAPSPPPESGEAAFHKFSIKPRCGFIENLF
jgi:hypothetical protein